MKILSLLTHIVEAEMCHFFCDIKIVTLLSDYVLNLMKYILYAHRHSANTIFVKSDSAPAPAVLWDSKVSSGCKNFCECSMLFRFFHKLFHIFWTFGHPTHLVFDIIVPRDLLLIFAIPFSCY